MTNPTCDICGREMVDANADTIGFAAPPWWHCPSCDPVTPDQHKIAVLERELAEAKANALIEEEQLIAALPEDWGAVEYIKYLEGEQLRIPDLVQGHDAMASQLRESQERELALYEAIVKIWLQWCRGTHADEQPCEVCAGARKRVFAICKEAHESASATAQQTVARIEREANQALLNKLKACAPGLNIEGFTEGYLKAIEDAAAILGEKL